MEYCIRNDLPSYYGHSVAKLADWVENRLGYHVTIVNPADQWIALSQKLTRPIVSLDKRLPGDHFIQVSRLFGSYKDGDVQEFAKRLEFYEAGNPYHIDTVVSQIKATQVSLIDDDKISGYTLNLVEERLNAYGISVVEKHTAAEGTNFDDIIDASDFIEWKHNWGGLLVEHAGKISRQGYLTSHVNLETRASIPNRSRQELLNLLGE